MAVSSVSYLLFNVMRLLFGFAVCVSGLTMQDLGCGDSGCLKLADPGCSDSVWPNGPSAYTSQAACEAVILNGLIGPFALNDAVTQSTTNAVGTVATLPLPGATSVEVAVSSGVFDTSGAVLIASGDKGTPSSVASSSRTWTVNTAPCTPANTVRGEDCDFGREPLPDDLATFTLLTHLSLKGVSGKCSAGNYATKEICEANSETWSDPNWPVLGSLTNLGRFPNSCKRQGVSPTSEDYDYAPEGEVYDMETKACISPPDLGTGEGGATGACGVFADTSGTGTMDCSSLASIPRLNGVWEIGPWIGKLTHLTFLTRRGGEGT